MTNPTADDPLTRFTDAALARPIPNVILAARNDVLATVRELRAISDADLDRPWSWKGGSEADIRYGFYRIGQAFELAGIEAEAAIRAAALDRGRTADRVAPATAARWDLQGLLLTLPDDAWDADPGGGEWTIRQTLGHVVSGQRGYGAMVAWWQAQGLRAEDPNLPYAPESIFAELPSEETEGDGTPAEVRDRLDEVLDGTTECLAGLPAERLAFAARWSGFAVDVGFRIGRWSSHIREHTIQVEKTLAMLDRRPTEVDRLVRLVLASWGRAEAVVYGSAEAGDAVRPLAGAAAAARATATELARAARG